MIARHSAVREVDDTVERRRFITDVGGGGDAHCTMEDVAFGESNDGVMTLWGPGLSGSVAVTLVETHNATLRGAGRERVEYFAQHLSSEDDILHNSTSCATARGHGRAPRLLRSFTPAHIITITTITTITTTA